MREKFSFSIISNLITQSLTILSSYFIALKFEVELIGMLGFATSSIALFSLLVSLGFNSIYIQHVRDEKFDELFSIFFFLKSIVILINYFPIFLFLIIFRIDLIILLLLIGRTVSEFNSIFINHLTCKLKIFKAKFPSFIISIIESFTQIIIAFNVESVSNPLILLLAFTLIFTLLRFLFSLLISINEITFLKLNSQNLKDFIKDTKPLIFMTFINVISINLGNVLLGLSYGYETYAYYNLIYNNIIAYLLLVTGSTQTAYMAFVSHKLSENKIQEIKSNAHLLKKYASIFFLFIIIFVFINSEALFKVLLPNYLPSVIFLYIMIFIPFFAGINRPYSLLLIPAKKQKLRAYYSSIKTMIVIFLQILIVPQSIFSLQLLGFGAIGLSILNILIWGLECFWYRYMSKKLFKISSYKRIYLHILIAFVAFIATFAFKQFFLLNFVENLLIVVLISSVMIFGIYFVILWIVKELRKEDLSFFLSLFNLKAYKESFLKELKK